MPAPTTTSISSALALGSSRPIVRNRLPCLIASTQACHQASTVPACTAPDTVERFQGQEKAVMIASFGLGDVDQIAAEEEFLYSLNRFNVIASRAKAKLIVIMSRRLVDHLPRDRQALEESRLLKHYATGFYGSRAPWLSLVSMNPVH